MKIAYIDCFAGISGDMFLGALLGLGIELAFLQSELDKLELRGYTLDLGQSKKASLVGNRFEVKIASHGHIQRNFNDISRLIESSELNENVKEKSIFMFETLAKAEAKVHGIEVSEVHFHELGAIDSIIDIVGAVICLGELSISKLISSPVNVGRGNVRTLHGLLPVPAPATLELLKDKPIYASEVEAELTTPTGALILKTLVNEFGSMPKMKIEEVGYGSGSLFFDDFPNMLRISLGYPLTTEIQEKDMSVIETNIDDMNPQFYDYIMERLFAQGARDIFFSPIYMKKNRPATKLTVLALPEDTETLCDIIFSETTSLGIRTYSVRRKELKREICKMKTAWGEVRMKMAKLDNGSYKVAPEYEDCKKIAKERGLAINEVYRELLDVGKSQLKW